MQFFILKELLTYIKRNLNIDVMCDEKARTLDDEIATVYVKVFTNNLYI